MPKQTSPRLLIYSNEFPQSGSAGGILLDRLLKDYPPMCVRMVGPDPQKTSGPLRFRHISIGMPWSKLEYSRFNRLHRTLRSYGLIPLKRPGDIERLLGDFHPEVVLTVMQHGTWYDSAMRYAKARKVRLITIIHDDNEGFDKVFGWALAAQRRRDGEFYRFARHRLCVSPEMEEEFFRRHGVRGEVMYPNRSEDLTPRAPGEGRLLRAPGRLTMGFVGNPNYGYGEQLVKMLPAIRAAGARLIVWGHPPGGAAAPLSEAPGLVELRGFRPAVQAWQEVKNECDAVIFPYLDPPGAMERLYAIHFPSKLPEYLALGMPIVMVGSERATGIRWAQRNKEAVCLLDSRAPQTWTEDLRRLGSDGNLRERKAAAALVAGQRDFDPVEIRMRFLASLNDGI